MVLLLGSECTCPVGALYLELFGGSGVEAGLVLCLAMVLELT